MKHSTTIAGANQAERELFSRLVAAETDLAALVRVLTPLIGGVQIYCLHSRACIEGLCPRCTLEEILERRAGAP